MKRQSAAEALLKIHDLLARDQNEDAQELASAVVADGDRTATGLAYFRSVIAVRLLDTTLALDILDEALANGVWFGRQLVRQSPSWQPLQGVPRFEAAAAICEARQDEANKHHRAPIVVGAVEGQDQVPLGVMMVLHGNFQDAKAARDAWPSPPPGWAFLFPEGPQAEAPGMFVWNEQDTAMRQLGLEFAQFARVHAIDPERVVMGGFSMGGETALRASLTGAVPARQFLLVAPGGPGFEDPSVWRKLARASSAKGRISPVGHVIAGGEDRPEQARSVVLELTAGGVECSLDVIDGLGHDYPPSFAADALNRIQDLDSAIPSPRAVA